MEPHIDKKSSGGWYALAGLAIGAAIGVLFAPKGGAETREEIDRWAQRNRRRVNGWIDSVGNAVPARIRAAAGFGAAKGAMDEAFDLSKDKVKSFVNPR